MNLLGLQTPVGDTDGVRGIVGHPLLVNLLDKHLCVDFTDIAALIGNPKDGLAPIVGQNSDNATLRNIGELKLLEPSAPTDAQSLESSATPIVAPFLSYNHKRKVASLGVAQGSVDTELAVVGTLDLLCEHKRALGPVEQTCAGRVPRGRFPR